jgi:hypothetical protein
MSVKPKQMGNNFSVAEKDMEDKSPLARKY